MTARLEFSDERFVFAGNPYPDIPLLVDSSNRFVEPICTYLRQSVIMHHIKPTSARTYAEHICSFWNYIENHGLDWVDLNDNDLIQWQNNQRREGVSTSSIASRCDTVFNMYLWFELNGFTRHSVRIPGWNDSEKFKPRLSSVLSRTLVRRRGRSYGHVSAVRPRTHTAHIHHVPTNDEISRLYLAAENPFSSSLTERNHLLIDWYVQTGARRAEWRGLVIEQIPNWDTIYSILERGETYELRLIQTKGGRSRNIGILPHLLEKTREYIEGSRMDLVRRFQKTKGATYDLPNEIFLSEKTGKPLALRAITNLVSSWFSKAGIEGHGHRLRASYLTNLLDAEIAAEEMRVLNNPGSKSAADYEFILRRVAERAGHLSIEYLRPYLVFVRKRQLREANIDNHVTLQLSIESKRQELAILEGRHKKI